LLGLPNRTAKKQATHWTRERCLIRAGSDRRGGTVRRVGPPPPLLAVRSSAPPRATETSFSLERLSAASAAMLKQTISSEVVAFGRSRTLARV